MVDQGMQEVPRSEVRRRDLLDGGFALSLLTLAIVAGYVTLAPATSRARTVATSPAAPRPGAEPLAVNAITIATPPAAQTSRNAAVSPKPDSSATGSRIATLTPQTMPAPASVPAPTV